ncbi:TRAP transporter substrate-binding protein [Solirubrobacter soli]|uniref:TRAP transporter substrate-binding protein n=1 Tax=Solirubrobacter soli TaxID=363832 RepID=UPI00040E5747|nr:hypothetical protein [Solirubrobacter soli]
MRRRWLLLALALAGCGGHDAAGGTSADDLKIEIALRDGSPEILTAYSEELARENIRVTPRIKWRERDPRPEAGTLADVRSGRLSFALVAARAFDTLGTDAFEPLLTPFSVDSLALQRAVLESPLAGAALREVDASGVVGVAVLPGPPRHVLGLRRPLLTPRDFAGARIGVRDSRLSAETFQRLGATTAPFVADDRSGFDGVEIDLTAIEQTRADEGAAVIDPDLVLWPRIMVLIANRAAWNRLAATQRSRLRDAARAALPATLAGIRALDDESYDIICARGSVTFAHADVTALRRAVGLREDPRIARLRADLPPEPPHRACTPSRRAVQSGPTKIDGVWTFTSDRDDLVRHGVRGGGLTPENWGHHVLVFSRGRFAITQEEPAAPACTWVYGTYAVRGRRVVWDVIDGGGYGPQSATNRPGEHFVYTWSRFKDTLELGPVRGAISAFNFDAKPWRRIGDDPARAPLSRTCPPPAPARQF